jgi:hypothetical protein
MYPAPHAVPDHPPGAPVEWDLVTMMDSGAVAAHHRPDPAVLARCSELRALQVALVLIGLYDVFGDLQGWDEGIRSMLALLPPTAVS